MYKKLLQTTATPYNLRGQIFILLHKSHFNPLKLRYHYLKMHLDTFYKFRLHYFQQNSYIG